MMALGRRRFSDDQPAATWLRSGYTVRHRVAHPGPWRGVIHFESGDRPVPCNHAACFPASDLVSVCLDDIALSASPSSCR